MTDRLEYVLSTAKSKSKKEKKKFPRPYYKPRCRPLILRCNIKTIILVNNYIHSNLPHVSQISFAALPHGPGAHSGLQVTSTALSPCHSRNGAARYCGLAAGLAPLVSCHAHPPQGCIEIVKMDGRRKKEWRQGRNVICEPRIILLELGFPSLFFFLLLLIRQACACTFNICMACQGKLIRLCISHRGLFSARRER
jgi:hypothetical protein